MMFFLLFILILSLFLTVYEGNIMVIKKSLKFIISAFFVFSLSACDNNTNGDGGAHLSAEQQEIQKYNQYIAAANVYASDFDKDFENYQNLIVPVLFGKKEDDGLDFLEKPALSEVKTALDKALAMKPAMPDLDNAATAYRDAVAKAEPVYRDLNNYFSAKTYVSDKGEHGRQTNQQTVAILQNLVSAQDKFLSVIEEKDRARVKSEFENAKKDTAEYYRAGIIYYVDESLDYANSAASHKDLGDTRGKIENSLNKLNEMADGYDREMGEVNVNKCHSLRNSINDFLSSGRKLIIQNDKGFEPASAYFNSLHYMLNKLSGAGENVVLNINENRC